MYYYFINLVLYIIKCIFSFNWTVPLKNYIPASLDEAKDCIEMLSSLGEDILFPEQPVSGSFCCDMGKICSQRTKKSQFM